MIKRQDVYKEIVYQAQKRKKDKNQEPSDIIWLIGIGYGLYLVKEPINIETVV